jgi:hypothetical protein
MELWDRRRYRPVWQGRRERGVLRTRATEDAARRAESKPADQVISGMINSATMFATLIIGLIAGPAVSL